MRLWINLIEDKLVEAQFLRAQVRGEEVKVWVNPSHSLFFKLLKRFRELRGILDVSGQLYVWDAGIAIHYDIDAALELTTKTTMMMCSDRIYVIESDAVSIFKVNNEKVSNEISRTPSIKRAYGNNDFEVFFEEEDF